MNPATLILGLILSSTAGAAGPVANCKPADFVPVTGDLRITTAGTSYTPRCAKVKAGTKVSIDASGMHPLNALADIGGVANPFAANTDHKAPQTRVLEKEGLYGYFCTVHGDRDGDGMAGAIWVAN